MTALLRTGIAGAALLAAGLPAHAEAEAVGGLQPFQMVRSLELVQDRIAAGDHAALPMQKKLLEMADARFRGMAEAEFENPLNRRALLVYAMSGGNPATVDVALARLAKDDPDRQLGVGILLYLHGQPAAAQTALKPVEPMHYTPELGAYLALVKGSVLAAEHPADAVLLFDQARLLSPGTLVEEAALRRTVALAATLGDQKRFMLASAQYVGGYIHSPYASQFADSFVAGVIALHQNLDLEAVGGIAAMMDAEREKVIWLRIARAAAIDGLTELSAFASGRAEGHTDDPRAILYSSLATVTSDTMVDVLAKLDGIDRTRLSESDRQLLDAARAVAGEMSAVPKAAPEALAAAEEAVAPAIEEPALPAAETPIADAAPAPDQPIAAETLHEPGPLPAPAETPIAETAEPSAPADSHEPAPHAAPEGEHTATPALADSIAAAPAPDEVDTLMADTRKKLDDIDKLLGEATK